MRTSFIDAAVHDRQLIQEMCFLLLVYYMGLWTGALRKRQLLGSFVEHFNGGSLKKLSCNLVLLNLIKKVIFAILVYHDALKRKEHHENAIFINFLFSNPKLSEESCFLFCLLCWHIFFYLGFLSQTFTIHRNAVEGKDYLFNVSLLLPLLQRHFRH